MKFDFRDPTRPVRIPPLRWLKAVIRIFIQRLLPLKWFVAASLGHARMRVRFGVERRALTRAFLSTVLPEDLEEREVMRALCLSHAVKRMGSNSYAPVWRRSPGWLTRNFRPEGLEELDAARNAGEGVILLATGAGLKLWTGAILRQLGYPVRPIQRRHVTPEVLLLMRWDGSLDRAVPYPQDAEAPFHLKRLYDMLKKGEWVRHIGHGRDHEVPVRGTFLDYEVESGRGPWMLARMTGAPLIPAVTLVEEDLTCRLIVGPPVRVSSSAPLQSALESAFQAYLDFVVERVVPQPWNFIRPSHWERFLNPAAFEDSASDPVGE